MIRDKSLFDKSIVFIGFMGVGKTTIGKSVAQRMGREFIDVDYEIEKEYGMSVSEIFRQHGEATFRKKERALIEKLVNEKQLVLSLGGGAFLQEAIREVCLKNTIVVHLEMSFECWKERIPLLISSRPVLQGKSLREIRQLFNDRKSAYAHHHLSMLTDYKESEEVAAYIIHALKEKDE